MRHQRTLREAFEDIAAYRRLLSDIIEIELESHDERTYIKLIVSTERRSRQSIELAMALIQRTIAGSIWGGWRPLAAWFMHAAPEDRRYHEKAFGCPLRFDAPMDGFVCQTAVLDKENAFSDQEFAAHARAYLELLQDQLPTLGLDEQVRKVLRGLIPSGDVSLDAVARHLHLHQRALQRRLSASGSSFQQLLELTREELALALLDETQMTIAEVAHLLGYQSPTSFTRWFTAKMGKSPSGWRLRDNR